MAHSTNVRRSPRSAKPTPIRSFATRRRRPRGAVAIVIATEAHRKAFEGRLRHAGVDVAAARDERTLVWLDATATLASLRRDGRLDRDAFFAVVGTVVRAAAASGRPVRAYGEMVALLWEAGDVVAAIELESLWNELATEVAFSLYCAYPSASLAGDAHGDALQQVCALHSAVVSFPAVEAIWRFAADRSALAAARRQITDALRRAGHHGQMLDDAGVLITELAANAIVHARSPFSVSVRSRELTVRIGVRDQSGVAPTVQVDPVMTSSGRGLRLVAALATRWGVDAASGGKEVWAELGPEGRIVQLAEGRRRR